MYELQISIDSEYLPLLSELYKRIVICRPPSYREDIDYNAAWLVWKSLDLAGRITLRWEGQYKLYYTGDIINAYREINPNTCVFTDGYVMAQKKAL